MSEHEKRKIQEQAKIEAGVPIPKESNQPQRPLKRKQQHQKPLKHKKIFKKHSKK